MENYNFKGTIIHYSNDETNKDYFVKDENGAYNVLGKLIDLASRKTDRYKADIVWDIVRFAKCVQDSKPFDKILAFRENGISSWTTELITKNEKDKYGVGDYSLMETIAKEPYLYRLEHKLSPDLDEFGHMMWVSTLTRVVIRVSEKDSSKTSENKKEEE